MSKVLVTGCAGFIGFHVSLQLARQGFLVIGIDNLSPFYDEGLKSARLNLLRKQEGFEFLKCDIAEKSCVDELFRQHEFRQVVHLAAQAGVRYSLENPQLYVQSNLAGFVNLIEEARKADVAHFVFASSSSVYGSNTKVPFSEQDNVDHPISLYAATKKSNELMAHVYSHLYQLPVTGLRFFTVYGPWGRPDMALFKFCRAILEETPIDVYNEGKMVRDFTYVDDVSEGVVRILEHPPAASALAGIGAGIACSPPYQICNIGHNQPVELTRVVRLLEEKIGKKAAIRYLPMQPGDVPTTYADIHKLGPLVGYRPQISIQEGISRFVDWYRDYYKV